MHDLAITDVLMIGKQVQTLPEIVVTGMEVGTAAAEITQKISPDVFEGVDKAIKLLREEVSSLF